MLDLADALADRGRYYHQLAAHHSEIAELGDRRTAENIQSAFGFSVIAICLYEVSNALLGLDAEDKERAA